MAAPRPYRQNVCCAAIEPRVIPVTAAYGPQPPLEIEAAPRCGYSEADVDANGSKPLPRHKSYRIFAL